MPAVPSRFQEAGVTIHYSLLTNSSTSRTYFAVVQRDYGWVALAFPAVPNQMVGSSALVHQPGH